MTSGPHVVDLYCGAGGFSLGFKSAGFEIIAAVDRSEPALETYGHNIDEVETICEDVQEFDNGMLDERTGFTSAEVDVVIGGPPCKGFSTAGRMDPDDPRNKLVVEYGNTVGDLDPEIVVLENVTGLLSMKEGRYLDELRNVLSEQGYTVQEPRILTAADYGVPQLRERVILIATKDHPVEIPQPTHRPVSGQAQLETDEGLNTYVSVEDAISDLAFLRYGEESTEYEFEAQARYQEEMRNGSTQLHNHEAPNHGKTVRERFAQFDYGQKMSDLAEEYQTKKHTMVRWDPEKPSPTVTTLPEDFVHYDRDRIPTVREIARVQSFPDWFEFKGPRTTGGPQRRNTVPQYTQVGNAVPPKFAEAIGIEIKKCLPAA